MSHPFDACSAHKEVRRSIIWPSIGGTAQGDCLCVLLLLKRRLLACLGHGLA